MKLSWLEFTVAALATYRISLLFTAESGPAQMFAKLRKVPPKKSATAEWLGCLFCFSMTASALVCVGLWLTGLREHPAQWGIIWCALSAVAIMIHMRFNNQEP